MSRRGVYGKEGVKMTASRSDNSRCTTQCTLIRWCGVHESDENVSNTSTLAWLDGTSCYLTVFRISHCEVNAYGWKVVCNKRCEHVYRIHSPFQLLLHLRSSIGRQDYDDDGFICQVCMADE